MFSFKLVASVFIEFSGRRSVVSWLFDGQISFYVVLGSVASLPPVASSKNRQIGGRYWWSRLFPSMLPRQPGQNALDFYCRVVGNPFLVFFLQKTLVQGLWCCRVVGNPSLVYFLQKTLVRGLWCSLHYAHHQQQLWLLKQRTSWFTAHAHTTCGKATSTIIAITKAKGYKTGIELENIWCKILELTFSLSISGAMVPNNNSLLPPNKLHVFIGIAIGEWGVTGGICPPPPPFSKFGEQEYPFGPHLWRCHVYVHAHI